MKDKRKTEIKVGITVLIALLLFIWLFGWAKNITLHSDRQTITVRFDNVAGLESGDVVMVSGVRKGYVDKVSINGNEVHVMLSLDKEVVLKEDAVFGISMLDLMGGKKIDIKPGISEKIIDYSQIPNGIFYADISAVMAMLGSVQTDLISIIKEVQVTLKSMNSFLTDETFNNDIRASLHNLKNISVKMNIMIDENRKQMNNLITNSAEIANEVSTLLTENRENIESSMSELETLLKNTNEFLDKMNALVDETTEKRNNLGQIMYDEKMMEDIALTLKQVKELTKILTDQLQGKGINVEANIKLF